MRNDSMCCLIHIICSLPRFLFHQCMMELFASVPSKSLGASVYKLANQDLYTVFRCSGRLDLRRQDHSELADGIACLCH